MFFELQEACFRDFAYTTPGTMPYSGPAVPEFLLGADLITSGDGSESPKHHGNSENPYFFDI